MKVSFAGNTEYVNAVDTNNVISFREVRYVDGTVPDIIGMGMKDAVYLLGNAGLRPVVKGSGKVIKQSVEPGQRVAKGYPVTVELQ